MLIAFFLIFLFAVSKGQIYNVQWIISLTIRDGHNISDIAPPFSIHIISDNTISRCDKEYTDSHHSNVECTHMSLRHLRYNCLSGDLKSGPWNCTIVDKRYGMGPIEVTCNKTCFEVTEPRRPVIKTKRTTATRSLPSVQITTKPMSTTTSTTMSTDPQFVLLSEPEVTSMTKTPRKRKPKTPKTTTLMPTTKTSQTVPPIPETMLMTRKPTTMPTPATTTSGRVENCLANSSSLSPLVSAILASLAAVSFGLLCAVIYYRRKVKRLEMNKIPDSIRLREPLELPAEIVYDSVYSHRIGIRRMK